MTNNAEINSHKNKSNFISYQVRTILNEKGFSFLFNWNDYYYYRSIAKNAFNQAQSIANIFISESGTSKSDYNEYLF